GPLEPRFDVRDPHPRPRYDIARGIGHDPTDDPGRRLRLRGEGRLEGEDEGRTEESSRQLLEQGSAARHGVVLRQAREGAELAREQKRRKKAVEDGRGGGIDLYRLLPSFTVLYRPRMQNPDIARVFDEVADLLEIQDANPFRVRAYRNAARTIRDYPEPIAELVHSGGKDLTEIPGIGEDLAEKITDIVTTGELPLRKQLAAKLPAGLLDLLRIP